MTVVLLEETPAVLSLGKLCEDHGYTYHWTRGQKPHLTKNGKRIDCNMSNYVPFVVPGLSTSSSTSSTPTSSTSLSQDPTSSTQDAVFDVSRYTENPATERLEVRVRSYGETRCIDQQKPKTLNMKDAKKYRQIYCMTCQTGCRSSERNWSMKVVLWSHGETWRLDIETLPVLLMNYQWSREQEWNRVRASTVSTRTFRRTPIAISA